MHRFFNKQTVMRVAIGSFIVLLGLLVAFLIRYICSGAQDTAVLLGVILNSFVAALGFAAIFANIQTDKEIKRFEYIAEYNHNFLTNPEFINVERKLETCNQIYQNINQNGESGWTDDEKSCFMKACDEIFHTKDYMFSDDEKDLHSRIGKDHCISREYQEIINYLVYLESFVPLLIHKQIKISEIDDLFGYRYFIAMNNPVLQQNELFKEYTYYRGCWKIYDEWINARNGNIPMKQFQVEDVKKKFLDPKK